MKLTIEITMDNAAFESATGFETARILKAYADKIEDHELDVADKWPLRDVNGNVVGEARVMR